MTSGMGDLISLQATISPPNDDWQHIHVCLCPVCSLQPINRQSNLTNCQVRNYAAFETVPDVGNSQFKFPTSGLKAFQMHTAKNKQKTRPALTNQWVSLANIYTIVPSVEWHRGGEFIFILWHLITFATYCDINLHQEQILLYNSMY